MKKIGIFMKKLSALVFALVVAMPLFAADAWTELTTVDDIYTYTTEDTL